MNMKTLLLALAALSAGCATHPIASGDASAGRAIQNEWQIQGPNTGTLVVTRDSGFMGAACGQRVYVDGTPIGDLRSGQTVTAYLPAGEHVVGVMPKGLCGGGSSSAALVMTAGGRKAFRVAAGQSGDIKIEPSAF